MQPCAHLQSCTLQLELLAQLITVAQSQTGSEWAVREIEKEGQRGSFFFLIQNAHVTTEAAA